MKARTRFLCTGFLLFLVLLVSLLPAGPVWALESGTLPASDARRAAQGPSDPQELEGFLDGVFAEQMEAHQVAGATVAVVVGGELFFAKGYGYADVANGKPVVADTTLFGVGSVAKLFVWTAVMQLVEQGQLDLHADVNTYLDFEIPATYPEPITLAHLMTHTPGFEQVFFGTCATSAETIPPLGTWLATHIPGRVRPPGEIMAYTNYGAALAAYIVERASGQGYDQYVEEKILEPLGMEHTSTRQPLPAHLASDLSLGYGTVDGVFQVQRDSFTWQVTAPAGHLVTTAPDMARFMLAHLNEGQYNGARILEQATARQMHSRLYTQDERLPGWAHGFQEYHRGGQRAIVHGGNTDLYHATVTLLPEHGVGLFIASNSETGTAMIRDVVEPFMDHYYPAPQEPPPPFQVTPAEELAPIAGSYRPANVPRTTPEKISKLQSVVNVRVVGDGELTVSGLARQPNFVEVAPLVFEPVDANQWGKFYRMTVRQDDRGNVTHLLFALSGFDRVPWYETLAFTALLLGMCVLLFLSVVIAAPIWLIARRARGGERPPRPARAARWLQVALVVLLVLFVLGMSGFMDQTAAMQGAIPGRKVTLSIPILMIALTIGAIVFTVLAWKRRYWRVSGRIHYTLVTVAAAALVWFFYNWNLFGWW